VSNSKKNFKWIVLTVVTIGISGVALFLWINLRPDPPVAVIIIMFCFFAVMFCSLIFGFGKRCSNCGKRRAMEQTGVVEKNGVLDPGMEEWKCKYCGHNKWVWCGPIITGGG